MTFAFAGSRTSTRTGTSRSQSRRTALDTLLALTGT